MTTSCHAVVQFNLFPPIDRSLDRADLIFFDSAPYGYAIRRRSKSADTRRHSSLAVLAFSSRVHLFAGRDTGDRINRDLNSLGSKWLPQKRILSALNLLEQPPADVTSDSIVQHHGWINTHVNEVI